MESAVVNRLPLPLFSDINYQLRLMRIQSESLEILTYGIFVTDDFLCLQSEKVEYVGKIMNI